MQKMKQLKEFDICKVVISKKPNYGTGISAINWKNEWITKNKETLL